MGNSAVGKINLGSPAFVQSFVAGDLTGTDLIVNHGLNAQYLSVTVFDENNILIIPDDVTATSTTVTTIDLSSYTVHASNPWRVVILNTGGTWNGTAAGLSIAGQTTGDLLYFNGTNWVRLAPGTSGDVLTSNGAAAAPSYQTAGAAAVSFKAYNSGNFALADKTMTLFTPDTELFDNGGYFDLGGTSRYTPLVAGVYLAYFFWQNTGSNRERVMYTQIQKNGVAWGGTASQNIIRSTMPWSLNETCYLAALIDMNGTTDYITFHLRNDDLNGTTTTAAGNGPASTQCGAALIG